MRLESSGEPDAWKLARPVRGWGRGETPRPTPHRNLPGELQTILGNCLAHGRRRFVDVFNEFPEECKHVLECLAVIYHNDSLARKQEMSAQRRLEFHQRESGPVMEELHAWLTRQFDDRSVEPNSALGGAISYLLKHWEKLTLFLRVPGAPLGRVEVWRGGLGFGLLRCQGFPVRGAISVCHAPFPHPAHRTGRADFPHPALLQNLRTSLSARLHDLWAVGTAPFGPPEVKDFARPPEVHYHITRASASHPILPKLRRVRAGPACRSFLTCHRPPPRRSKPNRRPIYSACSSLPPVQAGSAFASCLSGPSRRSLALWPTKFRTPDIGGSGNDGFRSLDGQSEAQVGAGNHTQRYDRQGKIVQKNLSRFPTSCHNKNT